MFAVLHPLLLWCTAAIAVPIAIHLLLRQRPRPRPWAAMRWLRAALLKAQRRYRLTNLLLLLLRCLIVLLIAMAVARPSLAGFGSGGRLVLVVDCTASMGQRGSDPGPLAEAAAALARATLPARVTVIAVSDRARLLAEHGPDEAVSALERLSADLLPGGLDRAAESLNADVVLAACAADADVVLVSDFQQDDGGQLAAMLANKVRTVSRWAVGAPTANAAVAGIGEIPDQLPGKPGELVIDVTGETGGVTISVDGGPATPTAVEGRNTLRVSLPPLAQGAHRLHIELADGGLTYDNRLELPLTVRGPVPALSVGDRLDYLGAALAADSQHFDHRAVSAAQLPVTPLPKEGIIALRARTGEGANLMLWLRAGGVLWSSHALLRDDPALAPAIAGITLGEPVPAGPFTSGDAEIDAVLGQRELERAPAATLGAGAIVLLRAGVTPVLVAMPCERGWVVVELADLVEDKGLQARGTTPLLVRRSVRRLSAGVNAPRIWHAGAAAPAAVQLRRAGIVVATTVDEPLLLPPGAWEVEGEPAVVVLPDPAEGRLGRRPPEQAASSLAEALPRRSGADWGLGLLIAALIALACEGAFAAWAGRTYGG